MDPVWEIIKNSKKSLFRFEGLQDYSGEDGEELVEFFLTTGTLRELPNVGNTWWSEMKERNDRGILTQRVRLVTEPQSDYTKMELAYLKEGKTFSGDDVRIISQNHFDTIAPKGIPDFWLIDDTHVFVMGYGEKGKYLRSERSEDLRTFLSLKESLLSSSIPIELYPISKTKRPD